MDNSVQYEEGRCFLIHMKSEEKYYVLVKGGQKISHEKKLYKKIFSQKYLKNEIIFS